MARKKSSRADKAVSRKKTGRRSQGGPSSADATAPRQAERESHGPRSFGAGRVREDYGETRRGFEYRPDYDITEAYSYGGGQQPGYQQSFGYGQGKRYDRTYPSNYGQAGQPSRAGGLQGASNFVRRSDDEIEDHIYHDLDNDFHLPAELDIRVEVKDGVVTLTGNVRNPRVKQAAGDYAWHCPGVRDVQNSIRLIQRGRRADATSAPQQSAATAETDTLEHDTEETNTSIGQEGDTNS